MASDLVVIVCMNLETGVTDLPKKHGGTMATWSHRTQWIERRSWVAVEFDRLGARVSSVPNKIKVGSS